jgi:lysyl endopeptidase
MDEKGVRWLAGLLCLALILIVAAPARTAAPAPPAGQVPGALPLDQVQVITLPPVDVQALLAEDERLAAASDPPRFAYPVDVDITPETEGTWQRLDSGDLLWRLRIVSPGALSLNLGFARYRMPPGGELYLYDAACRTVRGPFTDADNEAHGQLWTPIVPGDEVVVEVRLPAARRSGLQLALTAVNHGYTSFGTGDWLLSGSCNLDVVCSAADGFPGVDPWRDQIRAVAVYQILGTWACTGVLINNTAWDRTPYLLTANHCGITPLNASSLVVYWNYQNSWCRPPGSVASGSAGDGSLQDFQTGATFLAGYAPSDFTLVELDDPPLDAWNLYWAGWDRSGADVASAVTVHHPRVEEKRISFEYDATSVTSYYGTSVPGDGTHIRVADWDVGTTESGSSGAPLFNPDGRIVGQLHGGAATCDDDLPDWYGRFFVSWTGGGSPASRLSDWLDPLGNGVTVLNGLDPGDAPFALDATPPVLDLCAPADGLLSVTARPVLGTFAEPITLTASGQPPGTGVHFAPNPVLPGNSSTMTVTHTGGALPGRYDVTVTGTAPPVTATTGVSLNLYTAAPGRSALLSPSDGATDTPLRPTLSWSSIPDAGSYSLEIDRSPLFPAPSYAASGISGTLVTVDPALEGGRCYWWHVRGHNACGAGPWTGPFHFATTPLPSRAAVAAPPVLSSISPAAGLADAPTPVQIEGRGFVETPSLRLGDTWLPSVTQVSTTTLRALVPAGMAGGTYDLVLYNGDCQQALLPAAYTVVTACIPPALSLEARNRAELNRPTPLTATLSSGTPPLSYAWDPGGPAYGTGLEGATPVFTYTRAGTFAATVTGTNLCGIGTAARPIDVLCYPPWAEIQAGSPLTAGRPAVLSATVTGSPPLSYTWDMGDGLGSSTESQAVYTYTTPGDYVVALAVTGPCGACTVTETVAVVPLRHYGYLPLLVKKAAY